jgi:hypothetical protein
MSPVVDDDTTSSVLLLLLVVVVVAAVAAAAAAAAALVVLLFTGSNWPVCRRNRDTREKTDNKDALLLLVDGAGSPLIIADRRPAE